MSKRVDEPHVHIVMRHCLKRKGWTLLAGDYPGGTDGELYQFSVRDPMLAKDNSPDHRRHDLGENVPDLVAEKDGIILIIEAKPAYSSSDEEKLVSLFTSGYSTLISELESFCKRYSLLSNTVIRDCQLIPALAYYHPSGIPEHARNGFVHIYVKDDESVAMCRFLNGGRVEFI